MDLLSAVPFAPKEGLAQRCAFCSKRGPRSPAAALLDVFLTESTDPPVRCAGRVDPAAPITLFDSKAFLVELLRGLLPCCCCAKPPRSSAAAEVPIVCTDSTLLDAEPRVGFLPCCCFAASPSSWAADEVPIVCTDSTLLEAEGPVRSLRDDEELRAERSQFFGFDWWPSSHTSEVLVRGWSAGLLLDAS